MSKKVTRRDVLKIAVGSTLATGLAPAVTRAIIERYTEKLLQNIDVDVAVVGGGVSGLTALNEARGLESQ